MLITAIQLLHVFLANLESPNLGIFHNPLLVCAFGKGDVAVLERPANEELCGSAGVFLGEGKD